LREKYRTLREECEVRGNTEWQLRTPKGLAGKKRKPPNLTRKEAQRNQKEWDSNSSGKAKSKKWGC